MPDLDATETYVEYALEADNMSFYIDHWNSENDRLTSYLVKEHSTMYVQHTLIFDINLKHFYSITKKLNFSAVIRIYNYLLAMHS